MEYNPNTGNPVYCNLPRKFNIAVSGSRDDFAHTHINDIGLACAIFILRRFGLWQSLWTSYGSIIMTYMPAGYKYNLRRCAAYQRMREDIMVHAYVVELDLHAHGC